MDTNQPELKRSRISSTLHRTVSRMGRGTRSSSRMSRFDDQLSSAATIVTSTRRRVSTLTPGTRARSVLSRAGLATDLAATERTVKVCLVGDSGSGKTAFVK